MGKKLIFIILVNLILVACDAEDRGEGNCDKQINSLISQSGPPEEINRYDSSDGYHSHDYWYWCAGFERTFTWGSYVTNCEVSDYTFSPICY